MVNSLASAARRIFTASPLFANSSASTVRPSTAVSFRRIPAGDTSFRAVSFRGDAGGSFPVASGLASGATGAAAGVAALVDRMYPSVLSAAIPSDSAAFRRGAASAAAGSDFSPAFLAVDLEQPMKRERAAARIAKLHVFMEGSGVGAETNLGRMRKPSGPSCP